MLTMDGACENGEGIKPSPLKQAKQGLRHVGQVVKTPPFHGGNTSSNLVHVITDMSESDSCETTTYMVKLESSASARHENRGQAGSWSESRYTSSPICRRQNRNPAFARRLPAFLPKAAEQIRNRTAEKIVLSWIRHVGDGDSATVGRMHSGV